MWQYNYDYLAHHGILGQKWGIRRFQNKDGSLTVAGRQRYGASDSSPNNTSSSKTSSSSSLSSNGFKKYVSPYDGKEHDNTMVKELKYNNKNAKLFVRDVNDDDHESASKINEIAKDYNNILNSAMTKALESASDWRSEGFDAKEFAKALRSEFEGNTPHINVWRNDDGSLTCEADFYSDKLLGGHSLDVEFVKDKNGKWIFGSGVMNG